ncbi:MAG TPA: pyrroline-5-carboxylate reductase [Burkholderiales bacterium]|nr:pyrroline-5-carboxylate reductase [Burkholderiales bacterium]
MQIIFIGGGNMASALIGGLLQTGVDRGGFRVVEVNAEARAFLQQRFHIDALAQLPGQLLPEEIVLLAVKPQQLSGVAAELNSRLAGQLVITIAAGIGTALLSRWLGGYEHIVRVMPNTPALVRAGVSALYAMPGVSGGERQRAQAILESVGATVWVEREELMDVVTAVSGSGPAYVFYFMEAVMQAARDLGMAAEQARLLTLETFFGAAALARSSEESPATLRARVTSKGGTTERALSVLDAEAVGAKIAEAVRQAALRAEQLGKELSDSSK